jgi:polyphosphate kinase
MQKLDQLDVYVFRSPLGLSDLFQLTALDRPDLKYEPWSGRTQRRLQAAVAGRTDIFSELRQGDILVQHPYDAFDTSVELFVDQASRDPQVLAIKQTLYRTSDKDSAIVRSLVRAAEAGKQVAALVELTARFDEEANITWAGARAGRRARRLRRRRPEDPAKVSSSSGTRAARSGGTATSARATTTRTPHVSMRIWAC